MKREEYVELGITLVKIDLLNRLLTSDSLFELLKKELEGKVDLEEEDDCFNLFSLLCVLRFD